MSTVTKVACFLVFAIRSQSDLLPVRPWRAYSMSERAFAGSPPLAPALRFLPSFLLGVSSLTPLVGAHPAWFTLSAFPWHASPNLASDQTWKCRCLAQVTLLYPGIARSLSLSALSQCLLLCSSNNKTSFREFFEAYLEGRVQKRFSFAYARLLEVLPV